MKNIIVYNLLVNKLCKLLIIIYVLMIYRLYTAYNLP